MHIEKGAKQLGNSSEDEAFDKLNLSIFAYNMLSTSVSLGSTLLALHV